MRKGFSLVEFLMVIAIIVILAVLILTPLYRVRERLSLDLAADGVLSLIEEARGLTLAARDDAPWGVRFETARAVLFKGVTYPGPSPETREVILNARVEISSISLEGGAQETVFERLSGATDQAGTITLSLVSQPTENRVIEIKESGLVELED